MLTHNFSLQAMGELARRVLDIQPLILLFRYRRMYFFCTSLWRQCNLHQQWWILHLYLQEWKVGKVVSRINFWCKFYQDLDSFATPKEHSSSPHVGESRFRNPWNFDCGIQNMGQGIRNPTKDWNSESRFHLQRLESSTWNPESNTVLDSLTWGKFFKLNP